MPVQARWVEALRTEAHDTWGGHTLVGDEPVEIGGTNEGPSPFALLQMALANCTITTMLRCARDERIGVDALEVEIRHKQNRLDETATSHYTVTCSHAMTGMWRVITVRGNLTDDERDKLLWAAEHCPVSNSIEASISLRTDLRVESSAPEKTPAQTRQGREVTG
jgi:uncharacterized OsmC-like protein